MTNGERKEGAALERIVRSTARSRVIERESKIKCSRRRNASDRGPRAVESRRPLAAIPVGFVAESFESRHDENVFETILHSR